jgi:hypothetical protein
MGKYINYVPLTSFDAKDITHVSRYSDLSSLDVGENAFFAQDLRYVIPETLKTEFCRISARTVFPIDRRAGPGAQTIELRQMTQVGAARITTDYGNDIPLVNVYSEFTTTNVRSLTAAVEFSTQEIQSAALAGQPLDRDKTEAAREAMLREENQIAWNGSAVHGLAGFFTDTNIPRFTVPAGVGGVTWALKTGDEMVLDMGLTVNAIAEDTCGVEAPDTLLIPRAQYNLAAQARLAGIDSTALEYFAKTSPYIAGMANIIPIDDIAGLGTGGVDTLIAYEKNPSKLVMNIPLDIQQFAPQERDMVIRTIYHQRTGGVLIKRPISINIGQGI